MPPIHADANAMARSRRVMLNIRMRTAPVSEIITTSATTKFRFRPGSDSLAKTSNTRRAPTDSLQTMTNLEI